MNQAALPKKRSIDVAVYLKASSEHYIFCMEAKFLPPKDYVTGAYAAIKRFKKREHGLSNRNPQKAQKLPESAIIGYAKSGNLKDHLAKINDQIGKLADSKDRIDDFNLTWDKTEQLNKSNWSAENFTSSYSHHSCVDDSVIKLYHFWVKIKSDSPELAEPTKA